VGGAAPQPQSQLSSSSSSSLDDDVAVGEALCVTGDAATPTSTSTPTPTSSSIPYFPRVPPALSTSTSTSTAGTTPTMAQDCSSERATKRARAGLLMQRLNLTACRSLAALLEALKQTHPYQWAD
jgi:hypothetical protein